MAKLICPLCNTELEHKTGALQENTIFGVVVSAARLDLWKCVKSDCGWWCPCSVEGEVKSPKPLSLTNLKSVT